MPMVQITAAGPVIAAASSLREGSDMSIDTVIIVKEVVRKKNREQNSEDIL